LKIHLCVFLDACVSVQLKYSTDQPPA
jgi:hypothetical protein